MIEKEESMRMLKLGLKGYVSKDVETKRAGQALDAIINKGFYYRFITGKLVIHFRMKSLRINTSSAIVKNDERKGF